MRVKMFWEIAEEYEAVLSEKTLARLGVEVENGRIVDSTPELEHYLASLERGDTSVAVRERLISYEVEPTDEPETPEFRASSDLLELYRRCKALEKPDGTWPAADITQELTRFFAERGLQ